MKSTIFLFLLPLVFIGTACNKKLAAPTPLVASPTQNLARYDLEASVYDVLPVTTFVYSYDSANRISNVFEKTGQTLTFFALSYTGSQLTHSQDNNLGTQSFAYDNNGRLAQINFTTLTDTGKRAFTYDNNGLLIAILDSVKAPDVLPAITQYLFTYDNGNNNVVRITQNMLDLEGRATLQQTNYYTFDSHPNPFTASPRLLDAAELPGAIPALINKNNVVSTRLVGEIYQTSGGSSVAQYDSITNYTSTRQYTYNSKGYPVSCQESFQDIQYNYSGNRSFTYDY